MKKIVFLIISLFIFGCSEAYRTKRDSVVLNWAVYRCWEKTNIIEILCDEYEKEKRNVRVNVVVIPAASSTLQHYLYTQYFSTGNPMIDVLTTDVIWTPEFAEKGWIERLDDYLRENETERFLSTALSTCMYRDGIYALPWFTNIGVLLYRSDILEKENLKAPETWDDLKKIFSSVGDKYNVFGYVFQGANYEGLTCNFLEILWSNGASVFDDSGKVVINSKEAVEALQLMVDLIRRDSLVDSNVVNYLESDSYRAFIEGRALFLRHWPYSYKLMLDGQLKGKVSVGKLLTMSGGFSSPCLGGWNLAISKFSRNKKVAMDFIRFLVSTKAQKLNFKYGGKFPTIEALYDDEKITASPYYINGIKEMIMKSRKRPYIVDYIIISEIIFNNVHDALTGKKTAKEALDKAAEMIERIVASSN